MLPERLLPAIAPVIDFYTNQGSFYKQQKQTQTILSRKHLFFKKCVDSIIDSAETRGSELEVAGDLGTMPKLMLWRESAGYTHCHLYH